MRFESNAFGWFWKPWPTIRSSSAAPSPSWRMLSGRRREDERARIDLRDVARDERARVAEQREGRVAVRAVLALRGAVAEPETDCVLQLDERARLRAVAAECTRHDVVHAAPADG